MSDELQYDDQPTIYEQWHAAASECDALRTTIATLTAENEKYRKAFGDLEEWLECDGDECGECDRHRANIDGNRLCRTCQIARLTAERDQSRTAILAFGNGNDFDWNVLAKIDSQQAVITLQGQTIDQLRQQLAEAKAVVEKLFGECNIVHFPRDGSYPIEHNIHAKKDSKDFIIAALAAKGATHEP